jgi:hypothetical protein
MISSRLLPSKVLSTLLIAATTALTLQCGGDDGGGVTPPDEPSIEVSSANVSFSGTVGGAAPAPQTVQITNDGGGTLDDLSAEVSYPAGQPTGWLTGTLSATEAPSTLTLTVTTGSLPEGSYTATVAVSADGAANSPRTINVTITVGPPEGGGPLIGLSSSSVTFTAAEGAPSPAAQTVNVTNAGDGTLDALATNVTYTAGQPTGWLTAALSGPAAPSTLTLTAATGSLPAGVYNASVAVSSAAAGNSPQPVAVTFTVGPPATAPLIALATTTISFAGTQGGANPERQTVAVTNGGTGSLTGLSATVSYGAGQPTGWLRATLSTRRAPSTLTLVATTGSLPAATYTANVAVTSSVAGNSPQNVAVTFVVAPPPPPTIVLSSATLTFNAVETGGDAPAQEVAVTNGTAGTTLDQLSASVTYPAGRPAGWLNASLSSPNAPSTLTLSAVTGTLPPDTYTASVTVSSAIPSVTPQAVNVTLIVAPRGTAILRYQFENNLDNSGLLSGFAGVGGGFDFVAGRSGTAIKFNHTAASNVRFPETRTVFGRGQRWTISVWFREDVLQERVSLWTFRSFVRGWETYHGASTDRITTCSQGGCFSFVAPAAGAWHNVSYIYNGASSTTGAPVNIFVDGNLQGGIENPGSLPLVDGSVADLQLGQQNSFYGPSQFYVDEVRVYDHIFSPEELCTIVLGGSVGAGCVLPP